MVKKNTSSHKLPEKKEEPAPVYTEPSDLSKKLSSLTIGGNVLAKKKYISF